MPQLYYKFSQFLTEKYGEKVYKLPVNLPITCPNRDGTRGTGGCIFCGEEGAGFECLPSSMDVLHQINANMGYIGSKYKANKFIIYFQNYTNTYMPLPLFKQIIESAAVEKAVAFYISTRPDSVLDEHLDFLTDFTQRTGIDIVLELGLQSVNEDTLKFLNRGHGVSEFIDCVERCKLRGIEVCAHVINDLPLDTIDDVIRCAKLLTDLKVSQVKCHSLYILQDTRLGELYSQGLFTPLGFDKFLDRTIGFLENLSPNIVVQRILGRAPQEKTLFCSWDMSWRKVANILEQTMVENRNYQGRKFKLH